MQIIVLGMHRSGTSAVTRLINLMGAYLGPEGVMGEPAADNPKGFWERTDVRDLNDRLLGSMGCSWDNPVGFRPSHVPRESLRDFQQAARRIVLHMDAHRPWVMKDPRLCVTFPLWRPLLEVPVVVVVHRPPLQVARSLEKRNGLPLAHGLALWEMSMLEALRASQGLPRIFVHYADVLLNPTASAAALLDDLQRKGVTGLRMPSQAEIDAFIDRGLQHHTSDAREEQAMLSAAQWVLLQALLNGEAASWKDIPPVSEATRHLLSLDRRARRLEKKLERCVGDYEALRGEREGLVRRVEELEGERVELTSRLERCVGDYEALRGEREGLVRRVEELEGELRSVREAHHVLTRWGEIALQDLRLMVAWFRQMEEAFFATVQSRRWRLGNALVNFIRRCTFRRRSPLAVDHMADLVRQFRDWYYEKAFRWSVPAVPQNLPADSAAAGLPEAPAAPVPMEGRGLVDVAVAAYRGKPDIFIFPIIDWHFRIQRPQHVARELAALGHRVFYFSTRPKGNVSEPGYEVEEVPEPGVFLCTLHHAGSDVSIYTDRMPEAMRLSLLDSLLRLMDDCRVGAAAAIVDLPFWGSLARSVPGCAVIYDCMDHHAGFSTHTPEAAEEERLLLETADAVVTSSRWLSEHVGRVRPNTLIRNGAQVQAFSRATPRPGVSAQGHKVVGYVGAIAEWFDLPLVVAAAKAYPDWDFVLVGNTHGCDTSPADGVPNIRFLGERPYREIPGWVAAFDVCLIPFRLTELIQATNPVKVYEYLSAGKPVVATALPELEPLGDLVHVAGDEAHFLQALGRAMEEADDEVLAQRRRRWAMEQDWSRRARAFEDLIQAQFPTASVVVLTYNNLHLTQACLESLERFTCYPEWELILVDNASTDGTREFLRRFAEERPWVHLILNDSNLGFAAGNNAGIRRASGDYVVILNNDTYVTRGWLHGLVRHLRRNERLGIVGPVTNNIGNEAKIDIAYGDMDRMAVEAFRYTCRHAGELLPVRVAAFFCAVIPRRVIERVGLLDERFTLGFFEDDDYCRRVREAGYEVAVAEDVFVHHHLSAAFNQMDTEERKALFERNRRLYEEKWGPWEPHRYRS